MKIIIPFFLINILNEKRIKAKSKDLEIMNFILNSYEKTVKPNSITLLDINLFLRQIISLDEKNQIMTSSIYVSQKWNDERLSWENNTLYNDTDKILISAKNIWVPDMTILNSADGDGFLKITDSNLAIVTSKEEIYLILNANQLKTRCKINVRKFPFDTQKCPIAVGTWILSTSHVDISTDTKTQLNNYIPNAVWDLVDVKYEWLLSDERFIEFGEYNTEDLTFNLILKRRPLYFMINGIYPCLVLNIVTLFAFHIPFSSQVSLSKFLS